jgi:hypothetical protein
VAAILLSTVVATASKGLIAVALASCIAACSHDQGELGVGLAADPTTWLFQSHTIPVGWMLQLQVAIEERGGVPIQLDHVQFTTLDRGTSQAFGFFLMQKEDLDRNASSSIPAHGRVVLQPSLGLVPDRPTGPIAVLVEVFGTDKEGNAVSAMLRRDYPLGN